MFNSLFSRLYLGILFSIVVCAFITRLIIEVVYQQEDFKFFIIDANYIHAQLSQEPTIKSDNLGERIKLPYPFGLDYSARLFKPDINYRPCYDCELINSSGSINYYQLEEGEFLAEYSEAYAPYALVIYRITDHERSQVFNENNVEVDEIVFEKYLLMAILAFAIFVGITIYLPIRKLQTQIKSLIISHNQFGAGNLSVRADNKIQQPLNELADSFNQMAQAIDASVKEKDVFSQAIPHEIRTPLSRIQLATGLIRKKTDDPELVQLVEDTDTYVSDINELIGQIVEFSRVSSQHVNDIQEPAQKLSIENFVLSRINNLTSEQQQSISVEIDSELTITINPIYLRLALDNLIKNALVYADNKVQISAKLADNQIHLIVEDDGPGIPQQDRETIFIPFARLDKSRSRKTGGLGLGLSITKAAVNRMDGEVIVKNSESGGARFIIQL